MDRFEIMKLSRKGMLLFYIKDHKTGSIPYCGGWDIEWHEFLNHDKAIDCLNTLIK